jgi:hypothetical protein
MARIDKYYGTHTMIYGDKLEKLEQLGYIGGHAQFRIVCKAKSMAEANRIAESYGLDKKTFMSGFTSETGNEFEIELVNEHEFIIAIDGTRGNKFVGIKELMSKKEIRKQEDFPCTDCDSYRIQNFKKIMPDNTLLYVCEECGCENSLEMED